MRVSFTKMQGLGNDFAVFNAVTQPLALSQTQIRHIADRKLGIGCDQILLVEKAHRPDADFHYRIFNANGDEVEHCGNGARCLYRFVHEQGLSDKSTIQVGTVNRVINLRAASDDLVAVDMGVPVFEPEQVPFLTETASERYRIELAASSVDIGVVSLGNPHAVLQVDNIDSAPVNDWGAQIEQHPRFPKRVNVGFMQVLDSNHIRLRVFERGVGETLACGTGACAAVAVGYQQGLLDQRVEVALPGGELLIEWAGDGQPLSMTGPCKTVYEGVIQL